MTLDDFVATLARIPGFSKRNARKFILHLIKNTQETNNVINILNRVKSDVRTCNVCGNITFDETICHICSNERRDHSTICIVSEVDDVINLERGQWYSGAYHVLWGMLSASEGLSPDNLNIKNLELRLANTKEVIFAGVSSFEWQTTVFYITDIIKSINPDIKVTELARGVPIGSSLEFMDEGTLSEAFNARRNIQNS